MEIHAAHHPTLTLKDALVYLCIVTFAILITLCLEGLYARMQDSAEKDVVAAAMLGTGILAKPAVAEVEDVKRQLRLALGGLLVMEGIAKKLDELYAKALTPESANGE